MQILTDSMLEEVEIASIDERLMIVNSTPIPSFYF